MGALVTGIFATPDSNANLNTNLAGLVGKTLWVEQLKAIGLTMALSIGATVVIAYAVKAVIGLRQRRRRGVRARRERPRRGRLPPRRGRLSRRVLGGGVRRGRPRSRKNLRETST